jgi:SSS family solute:Na+ symporter
MIVWDGRGYGSRGLALAVAVTGILATMPYIALQLIGIQAVLTVLGVGSSSSSTFVKDLPLIIAFVLLAAYTYLSGLRAPALIVFVKDTLIYVMIIVVIFYLPGKLGGWGHIFSTAGSHLATTNPKTGKPFGSLTVGPTAVWAYSSLALGSALALFMYPHAVTGVLASRRRNMALLPAYSLMLGFVALLGYMALAAPGVPQAVKANGAMPGQQGSRCDQPAATHRSGQQPGRCRQDRAVSPVRLRPGDLAA